MLQAQTRSRPTWTVSPTRRYCTAAARATACRVMCPTTPVLQLKNATQCTGPRYPDSGPLTVERTSQCLQQDLSLALCSAVSSIRATSRTLSLLLVRDNINLLVATHSDYTQNAFIETFSELTVNIRVVLSLNLLLKQTLSSFY